MIYNGEFNKPYYEANVWIKNGTGDPLLLESFTTKREAVSCVKAFKKSYKGEAELDCFVKHFDKDGFNDYSIDM